MTDNPRHPPHSTVSLVRMKTMETPTTIGHHHNVGSQTVANTFNTYRESCTA